jgi:hypothetical protein
MNPLGIRYLINRLVATLTFLVVVINGAPLSTNTAEVSNQFIFSLLFTMIIQTIIL